MEEHIEIASSQLSELQDRASCYISLVDDYIAVAVAEHTSPADADDLSPQPSRPYPYPVARALLDLVSPISIPIRSTIRRCRGVVSSTSSGDGVVCCSVAVRLIHRHAIRRRRGDPVVGVARLAMLGVTLGEVVLAAVDVRLLGLVALADLVGRSVCG